MNQYILVSSDHYANPYYIICQTDETWTYYGTIDELCNFHKYDTFEKINDSRLFEGLFKEHKVYYNFKIINSYPTFEELMGNHIELFL